MKKFIIIGIVVAGLGLGIAGYYYYSKQVDLLRDMSFKLLGVQAPKIGIDDTVLDITLRATSESTLQATIVNLYLDIFVNDVKVFTIVKDTAFLLPAKGYTDIDVTAQFSPRKLLFSATDILSAAAKMKNAKIDIRGSATAKIPVLNKNKNIPIDYTTYLK
jgi:LEA14-like dessication related protein